MDEQCDICCEYSDETIETDDGTIICRDCEELVDDERAMVQS